MVEVSYFPFILLGIMEGITTQRIMRNLLYLLIVLMMTSAGYSQTAEDYLISGTLKSIRGDYGEAIVDLNKALENDSTLGRLVYNQRGCAKNGLGDYKGALADLNKAIEINPSGDAVYYQRGYAKSHLEDYMGAISDYSMAIEALPEYEDAYFNRGVAKGFLEDFRGAIADFTNTIRINQKNAKAYRNRGLLRLMLGQKESGCLDLSKAGELGSQKAYEAIKQFCK